ncbi:MAG: hypothetical protein AB8G96_11820 [Phycisphaerales bacterium]
MPLDLGVEAAGPSERCAHGARCERPTSRWLVVPSAAAAAGLDLPDLAAAGRVETALVTTG